MIPQNPKTPGAMKFSIKYNWNIIKMSRGIQKVVNDSSDPEREILLDNHQNVSVNRMTDSQKSAVVSEVYFKPHEF